jgi:hypothetical protein
VVSRPRTTWKRIEWALQKAGKKAKGIALDRTKWKSCMKVLMFHIGIKQQRERMSRGYSF